MANECKGAYASKLTRLSHNGQPVPPTVVSEEEIIIDAHTGTSFNGRRRKAGSADINLQGGTCTPNSNGTAKISFRRPGVGEVLHYEGTLSGGVIINGKYRSTGGPPGSGDQGTWEAQQTGGGGLTNEEDEQGDYGGKKDDKSESPRQSK